MSTAVVSTAVAGTSVETALTRPVLAAPAPRRQLFIATGLACAAAIMMLGGMLAVFLLMRERVVGTGARFPGTYIIPEVATNVMFMTMWAVCLFAQWAVYSGSRGDRGHATLALAVTAILAIAFINAQAFVYVTMGVEISADGYGPLFYAVTGSMLAIVIAGLVYTTVAAFRALGGRLQETEILAAHALYWYFAAAAYSAVWFVVYVTK